MMSSAQGSVEDKYEHYNYEQDKLTGHGGKGEKILYINN